MQQQPPTYQQQPAQPYIPYYVPQTPEKNDNTKLIVVSTMSLIGLGLVGYGIYAISGAQEKKMQDKFEEKIASNDTDAQIVTMLYDMIYPTFAHGQYGLSTTGNDAQKLLHVASQINDFNYVKTNYALMGKGKGRNLINDLQTQLEGGTYSLFIQKATAKKRSSGEADNSSASSGNNSTGVNMNIPNKNEKKPEQNGVYKENWVGRLARLSAQANIRTEPKIADNILVPMKETAKNNRLGLLTGKITDGGYVEIFVKFDTSKDISKVGNAQYPYRNAIKGATGVFSFIFGTDYKKLIKDKGILVYVHKDYIYEPNMYATKGSQDGYSAESKEISLKGELGNIAVSSRKTVVYDQNMRGIGMIEPNIKLGEVIYMLNDDKRDKAMLAFDTPNGTRWVDSKDTYIL